VLLAAILAPTDPVLASDVQVEDSSDRDRLRFSLTRKAASTTALRSLSSCSASRCSASTIRKRRMALGAVDVSVEHRGGFALGGALGAIVGKLVVYLRTAHQEAVGMDEFLTLGLIAIAYGVAQLSHASGFLAVFAAGLALQRIEATSKSDASTAVAKAKVILEAGIQRNCDGDCDARKLAGTYMMQAVRGLQRPARADCRARRW
jgi:NhaP-type Na+/H+ or K+/H+ antiporter